MAPDQYSGFNVAGVDVIEYPDWARMGVYVMPLDVHEPIEHVVEGIQQTARPRGRDKSDWWIAPTTRPAALDELLVAQGAELTEVTDILAYDMSSRVPDTGPTSRISCRVVHDARALNEAEQVSAVMWAASRQLESVANSNCATSAVPLDSEGGFRVVATIEGRPIATGGCQVARAVARLYGACTLPDARGLGGYRAVLRTRLEVAHAQGATLALVDPERRTSAIRFTVAS